MSIEILENFAEPYDEWRSVAGVPLGELVEYGVFDWSDQSLDWSAYAHDKEQYARICDGFVQRYYYRELGIYPFYRWRQKLMYKITRELCPKYNRLYDALDGVDIMADYDEYGKRRKVDSDYPETLLGGNADYTSSGQDEEFENIRTGSYLDKLLQYSEKWRDVDALFLDELECLFAGFFTTTVNND